MGRIYNVVFEGALASEPAPRTTFYYDWGKLPDGQYKVTFSFSSIIQTVVGTSIGNIYLDLGQFSTMAVANGKQQRVGYLGSLKTSGIGVNKSYFASVDDNPPIYLNTRPCKNNIIIQIFDNSSPTEDVEFNISNNAFTLCLSFELL